MTAYATYQQYTALGYNAVTNTEFTRLVQQASRKLDAMTGGRAATATGYKRKALTGACCALINSIYVNEQNGAGTGLASVSNDGYTETYAAQSPEQLEAALRSVAFQWLSGTGLMGAFVV